MSPALLVFKLQLTSHRMATILYFANMAAPSGALLGTHQNPNSMTWTTSEPNLVFLKESEPKYPQHPNTPDYN